MSGEVKDMIALLSKHLDSMSPDAEALVYQLVNYSALLRTDTIPAPAPANAECDSCGVESGAPCRWYCERYVWEEDGK